MILRILCISYNNFTFIIPSLRKLKSREAKQLIPGHMLSDEGRFIFKWS